MSKWRFKLRDRARVGNKDGDVVGKLEDNNGKHICLEYIEAGQVRRAWFPQHKAVRGGK